MGEKCFGKNLAEFVVDGGGAGRDTIASTISAEGSEKGTMGRTGVNSVETVDDVKPVFVGLEILDGLREFGLCQ